jgi:hypothetical protein
VAAPDLAADRHAAALAAIFRDAEQRLTALVAQSLAAGTLGTARYRTNQLGKVRSILDQLLSQAVPASTSLVAHGYVSGGRVVDSALGAPRFASSFSGVHQEAVDILADNLANALGEATRTVGRRIEDIFRREGLAAVAQGLATGAARRDVSQNLVDLLTKQGVTGFVDKGGRAWGLESYAAMVARTTTREAVSLGTANRMLEHGEDLVRISSHPHDPDVCTPYDGKTFSLTGRGDAPRLDRLPPFHPNCRHVLAPAVADLAAVTRELESAKSWDEAEAALGVQTGPPAPAPPLSVAAGAR